MQASDLIQVLVSRVQELVPAVIGGTVTVFSLGLLVAVVSCATALAIHGRGPGRLDR